MTFFSSVSIRLKISARKSNDSNANIPAITDNSSVFDILISDATLLRKSSESQLDMKRHAKKHDPPSASNIEMIFNAIGDLRNFEIMLLKYTDRKTAAIKQTAETANHIFSV